MFKHIIKQINFNLADCKIKNKPMQKVINNATDYYKYLSIVSA